MQQLLKFIFLLVISAVTAIAATSDIKVDQVGYLPEAPKIAFVV
jgi:hypothetical protein